MNTLILAPILLAVGIVVGWLVNRFVVPHTEKVFEKHPDVRSVAGMLWTGIIDPQLDALLEKYPEEQWDDIIVKVLRTVAKKIGLDRGNPYTELEIKKALEETAPDEKKKSLIRRLF